MAHCCNYEFQRKRFGFADARVNDFEESQWCPSRLVFCVYRIIVCVYWTSWAIEGVVAYSKLENGYLYPVYLSHWNDWTLVLHLFLTGIIAICGRKTGSKPIPEQLRWWHKIAWMVRDAAIVSSYLVTIMFYSAGVHSRTSPVSSFHRHAVSSMVHTVDLFVSKIPVRLLHFVYSSLYFFIYAFFTLNMHWTGVTSHLYDKAIDWEFKPGVSMAIFFAVVVIISPFLHTLVFVFYHLRCFLARIFGCAIKPGQRQIVSDVVSDEEMKDGRHSWDSNV